MFSLRRGEEIRRSPTVVEAVATTHVNNSEIPPLGCTAVQFWWAPLSSDRRVCSAVRWRGSHHWTPTVLFPSRELGRPCSAQALEDDRHALRQEEVLQLAYAASSVGCSSL
uniref:Uncharacterized protein n=1 Tax=Triticum urartu TaxID=4572 RepID=A0A8R7PEM3_TRIUA